METLGALLARSRLYRNQVDHPDFVKLRQTLDTLLREAKTTRSRSMDQLKTLFVGLAYVRDIAGGRGERVLTYMMLDVWYQSFPVLAVNALESLLLLGYGSWRDIKGLCRYLRSHSIRTLRLCEPEHPLILTAVEIMLKNLERPGVKKWVPRESSKKLQWLFSLFVVTKYGVCSTEKKRQFRLLVSIGSVRGEEHVPVQLVPRFDPRDALDATRTLVGAGDQEWTQWCGRRKGWLEPPPPPPNHHDGVLPVLFLTPLQRDGMREAILETLWMVEVAAASSMRILVATVPPQEVCIDRNDGFAHNSQLLLNMLERHSLHTMNLEIALHHISRNQETSVHIPVISPGRLPVCLSRVMVHARYGPMGQRFDQITLC